MNLIQNIGPEVFSTHTQFPKNNLCCRSHYHWEYLRKTAALVLCKQWKREEEGEGKKNITSKLENLSRARVGWLMKISDWNDLGKDNKELRSSEITVLMGQTGEAVCCNGNVVHTVLCAQALVLTLLEIHVGHSFINPLEGCSHYGHTAHLVGRGTDRCLCSSASSSLSRVCPLHSMAICQCEITAYAHLWNVLSDKIK